jgi:SagB-type dehydrogenase family enzyme
MSRLMRTTAFFRPPERPCLLPGLVLVPLERGLLVEGTDQRQVIRGPGITSLVPRLFPLLDGTRAPDEISELLPDVPVQAIEDALSLLYTRGLLQDGPFTRAAELKDVPPAVAGFVARHVDTTRANLSANQALEQLRSVRVAITGNSGVAPLLSAELARCGLTEVPFDQATLIVALVLGEDNQIALAELDDLSNARKVPWLRAAMVGSLVELGPYFAVPRKYCYRCFAARHLQSAEGTAAEPGWLLAFVALVASETVFLASHICPPVTSQGLLVVELDDWSQNQLWPLRLPGCPQCCPLPSKLITDIKPALAYQQVVESRSSDLLYPKHHQAHFAIANYELQAVTKRYPSFRLELMGEEVVPQGSFLSIRQGSARHHLEKAALAGLLRRIAGFRHCGSRRSRWAPSAGNLGSVGAYVITRGLPALAHGVYAYSPLDDSLAVLCSEPRLIDVDALIDRTVGRSAQALLVLTADIARSCAKYGPLAYHLVHLDAGAALAQCVAWATGLGITTCVCPRWDDAVLAQSLLLHPDIEPITAVIGLEGAPS